MSECILCEEAITNPVCMDCVEKEIETWLQEVQPGLVNELKTKTEEIRLGLGKTYCILCDSDMCICTYCYTAHIFSWLKKYPKLVKEFRMLFDFKEHIPLYECRVLSKHPELLTLI